MRRKGCHLTTRRLRATAAAGQPLTGQIPAGSGVWDTRSGISRGGPWHKACLPRHVVHVDRAGVNK